jgi:hypothetical protein
MTLDSILTKCDSGVWHVDGAHFERETFHDFHLPHRFGAVEFRDTHFDRCSVSPGSCMLGRGLTLRSVRFTDFSCGDAMHIDARVEMIDVPIEGSRSPRMLWIRSGDEPADLIREFSLDVSRYEGELWIDGVPIGQVTRNPQTQIAVDLNRFDGADWDALAIRGLSYWRMMAKKVQASGSRQGIVGLPSPSGRNYDTSMSELERLRSEGVLY